MDVRIISPEGEIFTGKADAVFLPGAAGGFELLDHHAPIVSTLAQGEVTLRRADGFADRTAGEGLIPDEKGELVLEVTSGVVKAQDDRVTILID